MAVSHAITPGPQLKTRVLATIFAEDSIDLDNLPPTNKYSNYKSWLKAVEHLLPIEPLEDFFAHVLHQNGHIAQTLVVTKLNVPEETHDIVAESFFILKGTCTCTVGKNVFTLNAGDHLEIPLHTNHDIRIDSPYVVAILQHRFD
nr:cupin domain-containing protein [Mucilaginibacter sp. UR6-1]